MKSHFSIAVIVVLFALNLFSQQKPTSSRQHEPQPASTGPMTTAAKPDSEDIEQLRGDVQRLRVLLNQMRNNLAFVQTSQTPLKHQFELEGDAWQVIVDQMDRRLKRMESDTGSRH